MIQVLSNLNSSNFGIQFEIVQEENVEENIGESVLEIIDEEDSDLDTFSPFSFSFSSFKSTAIVPNVMSGV